MLSLFSGDILRSWHEPDSKLLGTQAEAKSVVFRRRSSSHSRLEGELLEHPGEEEEEVGPGKALPRAPPLAHGEGHQPLLPPHRP